MSQNTIAEEIESVEYSNWTMRPVPADEQIKIRLAGRRGRIVVLPEGDNNRDGSISSPEMYDTLKEYTGDVGEEAPVDGLTLHKNDRDPQASYISEESDDTPEPRDVDTDETTSAVVETVTVEPSEGERVRTPTHVTRNDVTAERGQTLPESWDVTCVYEIDGRVYASAVTPDGTDVEMAHRGGEWLASIDHTAPEGLDVGTDLWLSEEQKA